MRKKLNLKLTHFIPAFGLALAGCSAVGDVGVEPPTGSISSDFVRITASGVSGIPEGLAYSEASIERALPGYDASSITMATESKTQSALAVFKDGLQVLQIVPGSAGTVSAIHGVSARISGPNGERIGMSFDEARINRSACREGSGNWLGMPICTARGAPNVTLVFAIPGYISPDGLPDDATLGSATLQRIIWTTPGGEAT
jgi:hypothetical protein